MQHSLIAKLISFLLFYPLTINSALSKNIDSQLISNQLESILNQNNNDSLKNLFIQKSYEQFEKQFLLQNYLGNANFGLFSLTQ